MSGDIPTTLPIVTPPVAPVPGLIVTRYDTAVHCKDGDVLLHAMTIGVDGSVSVEVSRDDETIPSTTTVVQPCVTAPLRLSLPALFELEAAARACPEDHNLVGSGECGEDELMCCGGHASVKLGHYEHIGCCWVVRLRAALAALEVPR